LTWSREALRGCPSTRRMIRIGGSVHRCGWVRQRGIKEWQWDPVAVQNVGRSTFHSESFFPLERSQQIHLRPHPERRSKTVLTCLRTPSSTQSVVGDTPKTNSCSSPSVPPPPLRPPGANGAFSDYASASAGPWGVEHIAADSCSTTHSRPHLRRNPPATQRGPQSIFPASRGSDAGGSFSVGRGEYRA